MRQQDEKKEQKKVLTMRNQEKDILYVFCRRHPSRVVVLMRLGAYVHVALDVQKKTRLHL